MAYGCYGTGRDGTERKSYQDPGENPSVPDPRNPVDNRYPSLDSEWLAEYLGCEQAGLTAAEIAARFGVTTRTVSRWRTRLDLNRMPAPVKRPASAHELAERLLDDGCSFEETARTVGVARKTIIRWFPNRQPWSKAQVGEYVGAIHHWRAAA
jgi:transcriptional regulator with XRE-family HTH domain